MYGNLLYGFVFSRLFCLILLVGLVLFVFWAVKHMKKDDMFHLAMTLIIAGVIGLVISTSYGFGLDGRDGNKTSYQPNQACGRNLLPLPGMMNNFR